MKKHLLGSILFLLVFTAAAVEHRCTEVENNVIQTTVKVGVSSRKITGDFTSPLWEQVPAYSFMHNITNPVHINLAPSESARVRYLCDPENFFVRVDLDDEDVMTCAGKNQQFHYQQGDLTEVLLKPKDHPYYWEIYGTPNGYFSRFYFTSKGTLRLPSCFAPTDVKIGVLPQIDGTLNDHTDRDRGWRIIIAIPRSELEKNGLRFAAPNRWTVMTARYDYGRNLSYNERSAYPQVAAGYHATQYYANIEFVNLDPEKK